MINKTKFWLGEVIKQIESKICKCVDYDLKIILYWIIECEILLGPHIFRIIKISLIWMPFNDGYSIWLIVCVKASTKHKNISFYIIFSFFYLC